MGSAKKWALGVLGLLGAALGGMILLVVLVDPFQIYRLAEAYMPPIDNTTQVYSNAGIVRNYEYDSCVVGTSVAENFRPTYMDGVLGGRFIKLVTQAGTAYNHSLLLRLAFRTHDVRRVVYGLDVYSFISGAEETGSAVPLYLYNDNLFDDVSYWLNRSVLASFLPRCLRAWGQEQDDSIRDSMYCWAGRDWYGEVALYNAVWGEPENEKPADAFLPQARENLEKNVIPYLEEHPDVQFDFFFPPYSAAEWSSMGAKGTLEAMLALRGLLYDTLSAYPNVRIYDFAVREDWVTDLDNYKDTLHYGQWINDAVTDCIADGTCLVTSRAQLDAATEQLRSWAHRLLKAGEWCL